MTADSPQIRLWKICRQTSQDGQMVGRGHGVLLMSELVKPSILEACLIVILHGVARACSS